MEPEQRRHRLHLGTFEISSDAHIRESELKAQERQLKKHNMEIKAFKADQSQGIL